MRRVGVSAPARLAARLVAVLEAADLDAVTVGKSSEPLDVLVVRVDSAADWRSHPLRARDEHASARIVLVAGSATPAEARQLLVDDVPGLVLASQVGAALALAVRGVREGQISYPSELMPTRLRTALSMREKQILAMIVMGFSNAEIAAKLYLTQSTVKSHISSAFATLGVRSRKDAVALILDPEAGFGTGILTITDSG